MNYLILNEMKFHAFHGVMESEKKVGGTYSIFLKIGYNFECASKNDTLADAINYAEIFELLKIEMRKSSDLIEHLAYRIEKTILHHFPQILELETEVRKHNPPVNGEMNYASIVRYFKVSSTN